MTTENGGKIELRLGSIGEGSAEYVAQLETSAATFHTTVQVGATAGPAQVAFGAWIAEPTSTPPDWLVADARAALKGALRTHQAEGRWPRRITRWRPAPQE